MSNLLDFLTDLAVDPQKQRAFFKAPEEVMDAAELSQANRIAINSRDKAKVSAPFADEYPQIACGTFAPNPDPLPDPDPPLPPPPPPPPDSDITEKATEIAAS